MAANVTRLCALLLAVALAVPAAADDLPPVPAELVRMKVESADFSASARTLDVVMQVEIAEGWHVNAHRPTLATLVPTTLTVDPPEGFEVGEILYPEPQSLALAFAGGKPLDVYGGTVRIRIPLVATERIGPDGVAFKALLRYQACDDRRCLRPAVIERPFVVKGLPAEATTSAGEKSPAGGGSPVGRWLDEQGLFATLLLVFAMGLGLNLTPCVYPLISVTLAYFGGQADHRRSRVMLLAVVYALGIAITFSILGVTAALSGGLFGAVLQRPITLILLAALMVALALSSFGLYTIQPPRWLLARVGGASVGVVGALSMGLTMGIIAAPCVGPIIVGLLVAVGSRGDALLGFVLFFTLAAGLGSPYVALAAAAGSIRRLPRSGEWLVWIEHLFGFMLLGLALFFVSSLLPRWLLAWLVPGFIGVAGIFLGFLDRSGGGLPWFPTAKRTFGALASVAALWVAMPSSTASNTIAWQPFSDSALARARAAGRPSVVDFRADWCVPCIEMEHTTFVAPEVTQRAEGFAMLQADVTEMSEASEALLARYEVLGVPTTIFFDRSGREHRRVIGYVKSEDFAQLMRETVELGSPAGERADARVPHPAGD